MSKLSAISKLAGRQYQKALDKTGNGLVKALNPANLVRFDEEGLPKGFNKKGKFLGWGLVGASTINSMMNEDEKQHMGSFDSTIHSPTPDYSQYVSMKAPSSSPMSAPAGADGSLVFALDRTKNGGFL